MKKDDEKRKEEVKKEIRVERLYATVCASCHSLFASMMMMASFETLFSQKAAAVMLSSRIYPH